MGIGVQGDVSDGVGEGADGGVQLGTEPVRAGGFQQAGCPVQLAQGGLQDRPATIGKVPGGERLGGVAELRDVARPDPTWGRAGCAALRQRRLWFGEEEADAAEGGGVDELLSFRRVHLLQFHRLAAGPGVDESQLGIGGDTQDRPEGFPAHCSRPADDTLFDFAHVICGEVYLRAVMLPDPVVHQFGEFLAGQALLGVGEGRGARPCSRN
jgi:hypothetical protein